MNQGGIYNMDGIYEVSINTPMGPMNGKVILKTNDKLESFEIICIFNKYLKDFTPKQAEKYAKSHKFRLF